MGIIRILLIIIEVIVCLMLIGVILLQKSRDSGLGMAFGAGMGESLFGAQAGNVLQRITVVLAVVFLLNTTLLAILKPVRDGSLVDRMLPDVPAQIPSTQPVTPEEPAVTPFDFQDAEPAPAPVPEQNQVPEAPALPPSLSDPAAPQLPPSDGEAPRDDNDGPAQDR